MKDFFHYRTWTFIVQMPGAVMRALTIGFNSPLNSIQMSRVFKCLLYALEKCIFAITLLQLNGGRA